MPETVQKKQAKLSLEIICPECSEMIEVIDLSRNGKTEEREIQCEWRCASLIVPVVWVKG